MLVPISRIEGNRDFAKSAYKPLKDLYFVEDLYSWFTHIHKIYENWYPTINHLSRVLYKYIPVDEVTLATSPSISNKSLTPDLGGGAAGCVGEPTSSISNIF